MERDDNYEAEEMFDVVEVDAGTYRASSRQGATGAEYKDASAVLAELERGQDPFADMKRTISLETLVKRSKGKKLLGPSEAYEQLGQPPSMPDGKQMNFRFQFRYRVGGTEVSHRTKPPENAVKNLFAGMSIATMRPITSVKSDKGEDGYGADPWRKDTADGVPGLVSYQLSTVSYSKSNDIAMRLLQLRWDQFTPAQISEAWGWVHEAAKYQVTNGPLAGLFTRLKAGLSRPKMNKIKFERDGPEWKAVSRLMPVDPKRCTPMAGKDLREFKVVINWKSSAGMPYNKMKGDKGVAEDAFAVAKKVLLAISEGRQPQQAVAHPQWYLVLLKNKLDLYLYEDTKDSIRSYFVYPFPLTWLFSAVMQNLTQGYLTFVEDEESMNAHGFCWNYGGGNVLYQWVARGYQPSSRPVRGIAYSDDQLWTIRCKGPDGKPMLLVFAPDYKRMDLSLSTMIGRAYYLMEAERFKSVLGDKTWTGVFQLNCKMAFECMTIVSYSLVYYMCNILHSGVPGTPEFDQFASALCFNRVQEALGDTTDLTQEEVVAKLDLVLAAVDDEYKLVVKPETKKPYVFRPDQPEYEFPFLGKRLVRAACYTNGQLSWCYVPASDPVRAVASMTSPKSSLKGQALISAQMTRVRSIIASGAFVHPAIYAAASGWFRTQVQLGNVARDPLEGVDDEAAIYDQKQIQIPNKWGSDFFPTYEECLQLYLPAGTTAAPNVPHPPPREVSVAQVGTPVGEAELLELLGSDWGGQSLLYEDDRKGKDVGGVTVPHTPVAKVAEQGRQPKLTAAEREARLKKFRLKMERMFGKYVDYRRGEYDFPKPRKNMRYTRMGHAVWSLLAGAEERFENTLDEEAEAAEIRREIAESYGDFDFEEDPEDYEDMLFESAGRYLQDDEGGGPREKARRYKGRVPAPLKRT